MNLLKNLNESGTTIIQVTHNEKYAGYSDRIINLLDGWVVEADELPAPTLAEAEG